MPGRTHTRMRTLAASGAFLVLALSAALRPTPAAAFLVGGGWTRADVGLDAEGDGVWLSAGSDLAWSHPFLFVRATVDYVQKKGSHPIAFSDPVDGFITEDASVTLHVVEPTLLFGARAAALPLQPGVYLGGSVGLKVKESWSEFPGIPSEEFGYKDTDLVFHLGAQFAAGPALIDVRWSRSLVGQLLFDNRDLPLYQPEKAADTGDVRQPEEGFDTEVVRVGVLLGF
ncbi:hypothetical protein KDM41_11460 [bacterium]|nr:hypothetical protein [bacterium]